MAQQMNGSPQFHPNRSASLSKKVYEIQLFMKSLDAQFTFIDITVFVSLTSRSVHKMNETSPSTALYLPFPLHANQHEKKEALKALHYQNGTFIAAERS